MPSRFEDALWSEPSGRLHGLVLFAGSAVFTSIYVYYDVLHGVPSSSSLVMAIGFALSGTAESLQVADRRVTVGLRLAAMLVVLGLLAVSAFAPEAVLGAR
ncbi:hypothetical protein [Halobaculum sp. P14]|uniref:hypothetical protein n=1 Tax=Halobaculum sp. P14 TaxID=3421638 RepID=UPI003EBB1E0F